MLLLDRPGGSGRAHCIFHTPVTQTTTGTITDEGVARLRARIGVPEPHPQPPHYRRPDADAFRNVAEAYGDDNPLWCDPDYAAGDALGRADRAAAAGRAATRSIGEDEVTAVAPRTSAS